MPPRSYLFVPGDRPERFAKALACGADAVVLDLEDAVAPDAKPAAREAVAAFLTASDDTARGRLWLRINDEASPAFAADLALLAALPPVAVMLPKAERAATVDRVRAAGPVTGVLALVETARGVLAAEALAAAAGVQRLAFGTIDFALDLDLSGDPLGLDPAASRIALASRAAGLPAPVAGVTPDLHDTAQLLADLARARAHGYGAKLCIHPKQVAPLHEALRPTPTELEWARRVIAAAARAGGDGAFQMDGRMIDRPLLLRAQRLLERAAGA